jgi:hypothetical protein
VREDEFRFRVVHGASNFWALGSPHWAVSRWTKPAPWYSCTPRPVIESNWLPRAYRVFSVATRRSRGTRFGLMCPRIYGWHSLYQSGRIMLCNQTRSVKFAKTCWFQCGFSRAIISRAAFLLVRRSMSMYLFLTRRCMGQDKHQCGRSSSMTRARKSVNQVVRFGKSFTGSNLSDQANFEEAFR